MHIKTEDFHKDIAIVVEILMKSIDHYPQERIKKSLD